MPTTGQGIVDTIEVVVFLAIAVITGGLVLVLVGRLNTTGIEHDVESAFAPTTISPFATVNAQNLSALLFRLWEECGQGATPKTVTFAYQGAPASAGTIIVPLRTQNLCATLSLGMCGCGNRDDITFTGTPIRDCNRPAFNNGTIYTATCNTTTTTLDIDATPQPCTDDRTDTAVCQDQHLRCGITNDHCGIPRQCNDCTECNTDSQCTTPPKDACCSNSCTDTQFDNSNCGACGNNCAAGTTCRHGNCEAPFLITLAQDHNLTLHTPLLDYYTTIDDFGNPRRATRQDVTFGRFFTVLDNTPLLVTEQWVHTKPDTSNPTFNPERHAVAFTINDPMTPVYDPRVTLSRDDLCCNAHVKPYNSFAASSSLDYQVASFGSSTRGSYLVAMIPSPHNSEGWDLSYEGNPVYGIAQGGGREYAILQAGIEDLTGITYRWVDCESGNQAPRMCGRSLFSHALLPDSVPKMPTGPKVVFGDNIIAIEGEDLWPSSADAPLSTISLYTLTTPTPVQTVSFPADFQNYVKARRSHLIVYGRTLQQGRFVVFQETTCPRTGELPLSHFQIFTLNGTGAAARLENVTPLFALPGVVPQSTLVSIAGEPMLLETARSACGSTSYDPLHAYLLRELVQDTTRPRDAFVAPTPTYLSSAGLNLDITGSIASYVKDDASYLYLSAGEERHVWQLVRKQ